MLATGGARVLARGVAAAAQGRPVQCDTALLGRESDVDALCVSTPLDFKKLRKAVRPLVRRHPQSGRPSLYFNPMRDDAVEGLSQDDGDRLLDTLYAHCDQARFQYSHRWRRGDVLIWDNRAVWHQARFDFDPDERRYLHRIMLRGERPILAA